MPTYEASVKVTYNALVTVHASSKGEARQKVRDGEWVSVDPVEVADWGDVKVLKKIDDEPLRAACTGGRGCTQPATDDPHPCPYKQDVNNDGDTVCNCCDGCRRDCAMEV